MADALLVIDRLKRQIGELVVQNMALTVDLEDAQAKLAALESEKKVEEK